MFEGCPNIYGIRTDCGNAHPLIQFVFVASLPEIKLPERDASHSSQSNDEASEKV
jgi:hypothetical protein